MADDAPADCAGRVLSDLWGLAGNEPDALPRVGFTGPDRALPAAFDVTGLAAGVVAATQLAATELAPPADVVSVDRRHATLAFRSERLFSVDGRPPPSPWDAASGYYRTADDGLIQLHCNFPHHRAGTLGVLGVSDPGDETVGQRIAEAVAARAAAELEESLMAAGMCAARLRTAAEWAGHPQGVEVATLPVLEVDRTGDSPPEPLAPLSVRGDRRLGGVRVADLTRIIAGPVCSRTLAAHGADVVRVGAPHLPVIDPILADTNLGKRWAEVDLRVGSGRDRFLALVTGADVVVQGYRPGALAGLELGEAELVAARPGLIHASLSAWSHVGPWSDRRGFDSLVQTATGIGAAGAEAAGVDGTRPLPAQALDHGAGWLLAFGVMVALRRRAVEGGSWRVRTSLAQLSRYLQDLGPVEHLDVDDPSPADVDDLMVETGRADRTVRHVALPGELDGRRCEWSRIGSDRGADDLVWVSDRRSASSP